MTLLGSICLGTGILHENAVNGGVGIELVHQGQHLGLAGVLGQLVFLRMHAHFNGLLGLLRHL